MEVVVLTVVSGILFYRFPTVNFNDLRRKLYMVRTHLTVGKRAKRMPDTTFETTEVGVGEGELSAILCHVAPMSSLVIMYNRGPYNSPIDLNCT